jgi:hypothetical protein
MDALDRLAGPAGGLLARVDDILAATGAPDDHPLWTVLRRVQALPGDAVAAVVALRPSAMSEAGATLRGYLPAYAGARDALDRPVEWSGAAGDAFAAHARTLAEALASAAAGVRETSTAADAMAGWLADVRARLAVELAAVLSSAEAVTVVLGAPEAPLAAATIATRVLSAVDEAITTGAALGAQ